MKSTHIVGIDPGLVDTGVVELVFRPDDKEVHVLTHVLNKTTGQEVAGYLLTEYSTPPDVVFIEAYRSRSHYGEDPRMLALVRDIHQALPGSKVLDNTGVKKVIKQQLMELLGVWKFSTPTNHQDLRSAARIALLGMLKDEALNRLIADVVKAHLTGRTWDVIAA